MSEQKYEGSMDNSPPTHSAPACSYLTDIHPQPKGFLLVCAPSAERPGATCPPKDTTDSVFLKPQLRPNRVETYTLAPVGNPGKKQRQNIYVTGFWDLFT